MINNTLSQGGLYRTAISIKNFGEWLGRHSIFYWFGRVIVNVAYFMRDKALKMAA